MARCRSKRLASLICGLSVVAAFSAGQARAESLSISIDKAQVVRLPTQVRTVVVGNPLIVDVALEPGNVMVVTGKGYGETNLLLLDSGGHILMNETVRVRGADERGLIVIYHGTAAGQSYSCMPICQPRVTLGDSPAYFASTLAQTNARTPQRKTADSASK
jgi:hypothetical protein